MRWKSTVGRYEFERRSWHISRFFFVIRMKGVRKATKPFSPACDVAESQTEWLSYFPYRCINLLVNADSLQLICKNKFSSSASLVGLCVLILSSDLIFPDVLHLKIYSERIYVSHWVRSLIRTKFSTTWTLGLPFQVPLLPFFDVGITRALSLWCEGGRGGHTCLLCIRTFLAGFRSRLLYMPWYRPVPRPQNITKCSYFRKVIPSWNRSEA
jgi:hypothetical protein